MRKLNNYFDSFTLFAKKSGDCSSHLLNFFRFHTLFLPIFIGFGKSRSRIQKQRVHSLIPKNFLSSSDVMKSSSSTTNHTKINIVEKISHYVLIYKKIYRRYEYGRRERIYIDYEYFLFLEKTIEMFCKLLRENGKRCVSTVERYEITVQTWVEYHDLVDLLAFFSRYSSINSLCHNSLWPTRNGWGKSFLVFNHVHNVRFVMQSISIISSVLYKFLFDIELLLKRISYRKLSEKKIHKLY